MEVDIDEVVKEMGEYLVQNNAINVLLLDVEKKTKTAKRLVIATSQNSQTAKSLALKFKEQFSQKCVCLHSDGLFKGDWIVKTYWFIYLQKKQGQDLILKSYTKIQRILCKLLCHAKFQKSKK